MYILKTKGTAKIPDYIQIRDNDFVLITHFKADSPGKHLDNIQLSMEQEKFRALIQSIPFGVLKKL